MTLPQVKLPHAVAFDSGTQVMSGGVVAISGGDAMSTMTVPLTGVVTLTGSDVAVRPLLSVAATRYE
jgi:hypothetical protein